MSREPIEPEQDDETRQLTRAFASIRDPKVRIAILRMAINIAGDGVELR